MFQLPSSPTTDARELIIGAAHFTAGKWHDDLGPQWQGPFMQLIPFADGTVLQIRPSGEGKVTLQIATLEVGTSDSNQIKQLVASLNDEDPQARDEAHEKLLALGPSAWSILESLKARLVGEARVRVDEIIDQRNHPTLGRLRIVDDSLVPVWRQRDGMVYLAPQGITSPPNDQVISPAWISVRRGQSISLLPTGLARGLCSPRRTLCFARRTDCTNRRPPAPPPSRKRPRRA